jgi:hypothetical protein
MMKVRDLTLFEHALRMGIDAAYEAIDQDGIRDEDDMIDMLFESIMANVQEVFIFDEKKTGWGE